MADRCDLCQKFTAKVYRAADRFQPSEWGRTQGEQTRFWCARCIEAQVCDGCISISGLYCREHKEGRG